MSDGTGHLWLIRKRTGGDHVVGDGLLLHYVLLNHSQNRGVSTTYIDLSFAPGTFVDLSLGLRSK